MLTGRATPYLHNGVVYVGDEEHYAVPQYGILARSEVGFLLYEEGVEERMPGSRLKTPSLPIWVVCSQGHFGVMFNTNRELLRNYHAERRFELHYYTCGGSQCQLIVDTRQEEPQSNNHSEQDQAAISAFSNIEKLVHTKLVTLLYYTTIVFIELYYYTCGGSQCQLIVDTRQEEPQSNNHSEQDQAAISAFSNIEKLVHTKLVTLLYYTTIVFIELYYYTCGGSQCQLIVDTRQEEPQSNNHSEQDQAAISAFSNIEKVVHTNQCQLTVDTRQEEPQSNNHSEQDQAAVSNIEKLVHTKLDYRGHSQSLGGGHYQNTSSGLKDQKTTLGRRWISSFSAIID
ncbi:DUF4205 [Homalodisca vitripennis]|nr:DUF4205 [Homalodisca vitripennis]